MTQMLHPERPSRLPALLVLSVSLQLLTALGVLTNTLALHRQYRQPPTLVQSEDGNAFSATPVPAQIRTDATLRSFIARTLAMLFTWNSQMPGADGTLVADAGQPLTQLGNPHKLTTPSYLATYAIAPDFRIEFQKELASMMPQSVFQGEQTTVLEITHLSKPQKLEEGRWKVEVVASINIFSASGEPLAILPYAKAITVRALNAPLPTPQTPIEAMIHSIRSAGLEIVRIEPLL